jgi:hypothetical protein
MEVLRTLSSDHQEHYLELKRMRCENERQAQDDVVWFPPISCFGEAGACYVDDEAGEEPTAADEPAAKAPEARLAVRWVPIGAVSFPWVEHLTGSVLPRSMAAKAGEATDDEGVWSDEASVTSSASKDAWSDEDSVASSATDARAGRGANAAASAAAPPSRAAREPRETVPANPKGDARREVTVALPRFGGESRELGGGDEDEWTDAGAHTTDDEDGGGPPPPPPPPPDAARPAARSDDAAVAATVKRVAGLVPRERPPPLCIAPRGDTTTGFRPG